MDRQDIFNLINRERENQTDLYGNQMDKTNGRWLPVLVAEVGEVADSLSKNTDQELLKRDLIQVAAVAVAWLETKFQGNAPEKIVDFRDIQNKDKYIAWDCDANGKIILFRKELRGQPERNKENLKIKDWVMVISMDGQFDNYDACPVGPEDFFEKIGQIIDINEQRDLFGIHFPHLPGDNLHSFEGYAIIGIEQPDISFFLKILFYWLETKF